MFSSPVSFAITEKRDTQKSFKLIVLCLIFASFVVLGVPQGSVSGTNEILFVFAFHLVRYLDTIILAITFYADGHPTLHFI